MHILLFIFSLVYPFTAQAKCEAKGPNIILFTMDGVRNQEFFRGTGWLIGHKLPLPERGDIFKKLWGKHSDGLILGGNNRFKIGSSVAVSLPSYQAMMVGRATSCRKNNCPSVEEETVLEKVRRELDLDKKEVAVFASWDRIKAAIAKNPENLAHSIHPEGLNIGEDPYITKLYELSLRDLPAWHGARKDVYTFKMATHYLKKECPRLLFISLLDSDEEAHHKSYPGYVRALKNYDQYLDELISILNEMGEYGKQTTLFITTDHSRGAGPFWSDHGYTKFTEKNVFLYVRGRGVNLQGRRKLRGNHLMLRPTIEHLMGLETRGPLIPGVLVKDSPLN